MAKRTSEGKQFDTQQVQKQGMALNTAGNLGGVTADERNTLLPAYKSIIANPGYDEATKSAMRLNTLGGLGSRFGAAADTLSNRVARTRNTGGYVTGLDEMAREQGRQQADTTAGLESKFADTALSERDKAVAGLSNLYGVDTKTMEGLLSGAQRPPDEQSFWEQLALSGVGAGATVGAAALEKPPTPRPT